MYILVVLLVAVFARNKTEQTYVSPLVLVLVLVIVIDAQLIRHRPAQAGRRAAAGRIHPGPDHVLGDARAADPQVPGSGPAGPAGRQDLA